MPFVFQSGDTLADILGQASADPIICVISWRGGVPDRMHSHALCQELTHR